MTTLATSPSDALGDSVDQEPVNDSPADETVLEIVEPATIEAEAAVPSLSRFHGPVVLIMALGLVVEAWSVGRSRSGDLGSLTQVLFWVGLLLMFVPAALRVIASSTPIGERVAISAALTVALQLSRTVLYPITFAYHDEFIHENTLRSIVTSHHLFGANSLLPVSSYYPGMEIATDGVQQLTGLTAHTSAAVVLVLARLVSTLVIIGLVTALSGSTRAGCVAALIYTCNPQSIFFNAQFSYQSFALPLAFFVVYAFVSRDRTMKWWRASTLPALTLAVVALCHHLTAMLLVAFCGVWLLVDVIVIRHRRGNPEDVNSLFGLFALGYVFVIGWIVVPGNPVLSYLASIIQSFYDDIAARLRGQNTHHLFQSSGGISSPLWEKAATVFSILIILVAVLPVLRQLRRWSRGPEALIVLLGVIALLYPIIPLGHLTPGTGEVTDRASGFLFVGVGVAVALGPFFRSRTQRWYVVPGLTALIAVVFAGGVVLGAGPTVEQLPGPFLVSADSRSIDSANLAAAHWERAHLPEGTRVYADRDSGLLAAAVGGMYTVTHVADNIDASQVLLAPTFTATDRTLIRQAGIQYVIVDQRDSRSLPNEQVYIESGEYGSENRTKPVTSAALHKLDHVPGVTRVYSNGPIVIYDVQVFDAH